SIVFSPPTMRKRAPRHAASQSLKVFSAECRPARYFMRPALFPRILAAANAYSPYFRIPANVIFRRTCFLEMRSGGLCVALTPESIDEVFSADISGADYVEVRLD